MQTLATLYAEQVSVYGVSISKTQAIANKEDFFKKHTDFNQSITGDITVTKITDNQYKVSFPKRSSFSGKTSNVQGYLLFDKVDGNWKITNESDDVTDKNISKSKTENISGGVAIGEPIKGDFDGDGNIETAVIHLVKEGKFDEESWKMSVDFSNQKIPSILFSSDRDYASLINEGDLNSISGDEISILTPPNMGGGSHLQPYTYSNGAWRELIDMVFVMEYLPDSITVEDVIFKVGKSVYYYDYENVDLPNGEQEFKLVKVKATLK